jgi:hypothetical protein
VHAVSQYTVHVVSDAISSRSPHNRAVRRGHHIYRNGNV